MAKVIWRRPHRIFGKIGTPFYVILVFKSLRPKHDLDPLSHFGTAKPRGRHKAVTDKLTDRHPRYWNIDRNSSHLIHLLLLKMEKSESAGSEGRGGIKIAYAYRLRP